MDTIDKDTYADLARQFTIEQMIEIGFTVRLSNMINRFHAAFSTELGPIIRDAVGDSCPLRRCSERGDGGKRTSRLPGAGGSV